MALLRMTTTTLAVLSVLVRSDEQYGLKIANESGLLTGTVYPILNRLEQRGWVTGEWVISGASVIQRGPRRKFYTLTPTGRQRAESALEAQAARLRQ